MRLSKVIKKNYQSIEKRGLITPDTTIRDFNNKINEEFLEAKCEFDIEDIKKEWVDVALTALNALNHFSQNEKEVIKLLTDKIKVNENRR